MVKELQLTQGKVALVDDEDYERLIQHKWRADKGQTTDYAAQSITANGQRKTVRMHQLILTVTNGHEVHHIDGNGLNNQKSNLKLLTRSQHLAHMRKRPGTKSTYKGVFWHNQRNRWTAQIRRNCRRIYLGLFDSEQEAAYAYQRAAQEYEKQVRARLDTLKASQEYERQATA